MPKLSQIIATIESDAEAALDAAWAYMKPQITTLGYTVLSQIEQAAETYVATGGNYTQALASIMAQAPADVVALEHIVAGYLSTLIAAAQAKAAAAVAPAAP